MTHHRFISMLVGLGMMSACSEGDERKTQAQNDNGADVSLSIDGGNASIRSDGNSTSVTVDLPGVKGGFKLPSIKIDSGDVDIDGVKLYPGSRVRAFEVSGEEGGSEGSFTLRFDADASPAAVQRYFLDAFKAKGVAARTRGMGVAGTDHDGKQFAIDLDAMDGGTRGVITLGHRPG
jgi:hypothetical protein